MSYSCPMAVFDQFCNSRADELILAAVVASLHQISEAQLGNESYLGLRGAESPTVFARKSTILVMCKMTLRITEYWNNIRANQFSGYPVPLDKTLSIKSKVVRRYCLRGTPLSSYTSYY